ncbi:MAG: CRISPR-associated endoribonuclease Cas6, partial [Pseudothermotoga sp.]
DAVFETLMDGFLEKNILKEPVKIGNVDFQITEVILDNQLSKWAGHLSVEELIKKDFDSTTVKLRFYTPTLFRSRNEHCRYPIPEKIFSSLLRKFNKYSPQKLDPQIEEKFNKVHIFEKKTKSRRVTMKEFYLEGFIGDVIFQIPQDPELLKAVNVLSEFAFFAGVGYKTTMGLGQTRRVPLNEEEEEL